MARDAYTGVRADWLLRSHIKYVRKRIREARKKEGQLFMMLPEPKKQVRKPKPEHAVNP